MSRTGINLLSVFLAGLGKLRRQRHRALSFDVVSKHASGVRVSYHFVTE